MPRILPNPVDSREELPGNRVDPYNIGALMWI